MPKRAVHPPPCSRPKKRVGSAHFPEVVRNWMEHRDGGYKPCPGRVATARESRHISAGNTKMEETESAFADGTSYSGNRLGWAKVRGRFPALARVSLVVRRVAQRSDAISKTERITDRIPSCACPRAALLPAFHRASSSAHRVVVEPALHAPVVAPDIGCMVPRTGSRQPRESTR